jgi:septal ring factor EnvC (AmiA/AmiB activator)
VSDHLIAEANRHAKALGKMTLPTTQSTQRDIQWYIDECIDLRKQLDQECASKREHLRIACDETNKLKVQVGIYERENAALREKMKVSWDEISVLVNQNSALIEALKTIAKYDQNSPHGYGICPYGCDCPSIANTALIKARKEAQP